MKWNRLILKNKSKIAFLGGILVAIGFVAEKGAKYGVAPHDGAHRVALIAFVAASVIGAAPIALGAFAAIRMRVISIDVLVTIAVIGAFAIGNFEESAVVTFLFLFGAYLEQRTLHKTRAAIRQLTEMAPQSALRLLPDGTTEEIDIDDVAVGDRLLVKTGAKIPVDGVVSFGEGYVNQASITGESNPAYKAQESQVYAGSILENGTLHITAQRVGEDTTFGKIIELVETAQDAKSQAERFIDRFARYYTPAVLVFAAVTFLITRDVPLSITILVLGCPGALVIGVPISNVAGIGNGARHGILLKGSEVIHKFSKVDTFVFDKTGTLTQGKPMVADTAFFHSQAQTFLPLLASLESTSDHPLASALVAYLDTSVISAAEHVTVGKGGGLSATIDGHAVLAGNAARLKQEGVSISAQVADEIMRFEENGNSTILFAVDGTVMALFGVRDQIRPAVKEHLDTLRRMGAKNFILLSGDNQITVDLVAKQLGLTKAYGALLPEEKSNQIASLQAAGHTVAFVGDGINDSPSLALSDIGIAMGNGTDVAIETSDVVLINSDFSRLPHAYGLSKVTARNMRQNMLIAIGVVFFLLGGLFFSQWMNMSLGMLVHEGSILVVILNGMRLLSYRPRSFSFGKGGERE